MRKLLFFLPLLFFVIFPPKIAFAQELLVSPAATSSPTPTVVQYDLPYPGILPDNPLYSVKVFRDKLVAFFISNPLKKASFDILQSDKRVEASWYLAKGDNNAKGLVITTLLKSTNYLSQSLDELKQAKRSGVNTNGVGQVLQKSVAKHIEVVVAMQKMSGLPTQSLLSEEKRLQGLLKEVMRFNQSQ